MVVDALHISILIEILLNVSMLIEILLNIFTVIQIFKKTVSEYIMLFRSVTGYDEVQYKCISKMFN